ADAEADHERARDSRDDEPVRIERIEDEQRIGADEAAGRVAYGLEQVVALLQIVVHEVRGDLGIGLGLELVALRDQLFFYRLIVLDDAVVDHGDAIAGKMRMRVVLGDAAVRRPARVRNAEAAGARRLLELLRELRNLADGAAERNAVARLQHGETGRVIAAVLEAPQALDQHRHDVPFRNGSDYSAHRTLTSCSSRAVASPRSWSDAPARSSARRPAHPC